MNRVSRTQIDSQLARNYHLCVSSSHFQRPSLLHKIPTANYSRTPPKVDFITAVPPFSMKYR